MSQPSQHKWRTLIYCSNCWHCWLPCFISFPCALYWTPIKWLTFQKIYYTLLYNIVIIDWLVCCLVILQTADPRLFLPYSSPCGKPLIQLGGDDKATHDKQRNIQVQTLENCRLKKTCLASHQFGNKSCLMSYFLHHPLTSQGSKFICGDWYHSNIGKPPCTRLCYFLRLVQLHSPLANYVRSEEF